MGKIKEMALKATQKIFSIAFDAASKLPGGKTTAWGVMALFLNIGRIAEGDISINWIGISALSISFVAGMIAGMIV